MKKSKLKIGLVSSFIATMALSACSASVTSNKDNVVDFKGYNDQDLAVSIEEIYEDYMQSSSGIAKYYDQVMEVLIRNAFQKDKKGDSTLKGVKRNYNAIVNEAKDNVKGAKETAKKNADDNGTSFKTEWQSVLNEKGVKDEEELLQYFIYKLEKEEIEDWYFEQHKDELRREYLGLWSSSKEGAQPDGTIVASEASSRYPYHVRHILIKNESGGSDYVRGSIDASAAKLLSETVKDLAKGTLSFGEVALLRSEDSSNTKYGDVGIMTNEIKSSGGLGMVNEFQLGIYAYDAIVKNDGKSAEVDLGLGLDVQLESGDTVKEYFKNRGIVEIPYSAFVELGDVAELENNYLTGLQVEEGKSAVYPRNLLWNRFFNNHGIFVITNGARPDNYALSIDDGGTEKVNPDPAAEAIDETTCTSYYTGEDPYIAYNKTEKEINYAKLDGFQEDSHFSGHDEMVLCDENDNVIIGVRSEYGIHLMIVEKSAYDFDGTVKLEDYYTTAIPTDTANYPDIPETEHTYVDLIKYENNSDYDARAKEVKTAIKGFDSTYDYRLYKQLKVGEDIDAENAKNKALFSAIDNYIALKQEKNKVTQAEGLEDVWQKYVDLLNIQDFYRQDLNRVIPEGCKIAFTKNLTEAEKKQFEEGGACYVK